MYKDPYPTTRQADFARKRKLSTTSESTESTDDENNFDKCGSNKNGKNPVAKKYKTELCKNFSQTGFCPYRKKCKFAHGVNELNEGKKQQGKFYRTKKCNSFWNEGTCAYGQRCQFMHIRMQPNTLQYLESWRVVVEMQTNESGFAGSRLLRLLRIE